jgi:hypothetical protein
MTMHPQVIFSSLLALATVAGRRPDPAIEDAATRDYRRH